MMQASSLDRTLAALSDPTRRAVLDLLRTGPRRAGELAHALEMSAPALSRHLRILRTSGLIADKEPEHDARVRMYGLAPGALLALRDWIVELEGFWGDQLASFKDHVDALPPRSSE